MDFEPDARAGRYKVTHIYKGGPADKDWVRVGVGDYLISIDGTPVKAGDNYWKLLSQRLNRRELAIMATSAGVVATLVARAQLWF